MAQAPSRVPRGRHAPPREVREELQRQRLFDAAMQVFSEQGYADASAEAISRAAGMSKATFYEHFSNKRACMLEIMDASANLALEELVRAARDAGDDPFERHRAGLHAFLHLLASRPEVARTVLVESVGAGPEALERRDAILEGFAQAMFNEAREGVERRGGGPRFATVEDAFAIVGALVELMSRQLRTGRPERIEDLEPLIERLLLSALVTPEP
ncbi:MAG: TetR/AcrR family transcriptional regulator [Solirubrobacteraceae bacterium]|nr:TetR/AcrR family transcriptional regulator [Solirubrobacteraceae bacterium]